LSENEEHKVETEGAALNVESAELLNSILRRGETLRAEVEHEAKPPAIVPQALPRRGPRVTVSRRPLYLGLFLVTFGVVTVLASLAVGIASLSGLGLASFLIGLLVIYVPSPNETVPKLTEALMLSSVGNLERVLRELGPETRAAYIAVHDRLDIPKVFLPLSDNPEPSVALASLDTDRFLLVDSADPHRTGLVLEAPGACVLTLMEKESGIDFFDSGRDGLLDALRLGMVESLEIAADVKGTIDETSAKLRIKDGPLSGLASSVSRSAPTVSSRLGCPICSAVVCAIVKSTKRDIVLEQAQHESGYHTLSLKFGGTTDATR
jgi:hypothetical protein